jgi:CubicO group peptidase (beta-lactamase class C family)
MPHRTPRRRFLLQSGRAVLGASLLPMAGCSGSGFATKDPEAQVPATLTNELEAQVPSLLAAAHVPGLSIALVRNGQVAWTRGFGVKRNGAGAAVDANTLFEAGSVSKTVFAYAVMKLCEKGGLNLDIPLANYVPERWITDDARFQEITARHVLSHTSGLQNWRSVEEPLRIHFDPGTKWLYSGEGYSYLQLVVAHLTGRVSTQSCEKLFDGLTVCATEIDTYLETNLLRPFGMSTSGYLWKERSGNVAAAHGRDGKPSDRPGATPIMAARYGAAGGLSTTATEYARFLIEVLDPKPSDAFRLTETSRSEMLRSQVKVDDASSWALGWQILHQKQGDLLSHGGDNPGFKAFVLASAARKSGYVILTNGDNGTEVIGKLANGDTPLNLFVTG